MATSRESWEAVDGYIEGLFGLEDAEAGATLAASQGLPNIAISPGYGALLNVLAQAVGARSILEIGTLGGYSSLWMARALPEGGRLVTLEISEAHAAIARRNLARAGLGDQVEVRVAPALQSLAALAREGAIFDMVFIDADKPSYADYLRAIMPLTRPGTLIIADNVVRQGQVADSASDDANVRGARAFLGALADDPRLRSTVIQTVGRKGYDGFSISVVQGDGQ